MEQIPDFSQKMRAIAQGYSSPTIAVIGSHSALDISSGAKAFGFPSLVICQKGRDRVYSSNYKTRKVGNEIIGCVDEVMLLDKFSGITGEAPLALLKKKQAIFIPHRSFSVYVGYEKIEKEFAIPVMGNRWLLRAEERNTPKNQHYLLKKAGVRVPKTYSSPDDIDTLVIVKAPEASRSYERAFFFASTPEQYRENSARMLSEGRITEEGLKGALIEEFILGAQFNFNFFRSPLSGELELIGIDTRRQTNLDGVLRLPAEQQTQALKFATVNNIEVGHIACTLRESLLEEVFDAGERFVKAVDSECPPGLIGPFALQGAIAPTSHGEEVLIFDVSFRVPGSPGTRFTPYPGYLRGKAFSVGDRIAMEIKSALEQKRLGELVT
jgi:5-formaminoimidazole-4-carboxamide-1-(beta)-D-ribofuranosyl 5'-monophosphate synthetase